MLLGLPLLVGMLVGKLAGGSFRSLASAPLRFGWAIVLALFVEVALFTRFTDGQAWDIKFGHYAYLAALAVLLSALAANLGRLRWPLFIVVVGAALNFIVIAANGGAMPVDGHLLALAKGNGLVLRIVHHTLASNVTPINAGTHVAILGDHFALADNVYSLGDVFIGLGGFLLVAAEMRREAAKASILALLGRIGLRTLKPGQSEPVTRAPHMTS